jgi:hypothetical protein
MARSKRKAAQGKISDYRHDTVTRKNNPPAKIADEGHIPVVPKIKYSYNPHLAPVLRFDKTGAADRLSELLEAAKRRPLTEDETHTLALALRTHEPWLEWAGKQEARGFEVDRTKAKHNAAKRWVAAVNNWGKLGKWLFHVCRNPQVQDKELLFLAQQAREAA